MPFKSDAQRKAMYAAASGRGTIGIPIAVAKQYVAHGKRKKKKRK